MTETPPALAALYVDTAGCYFGVPGVDPWDQARDARRYDGPHPVIAHPPCERWGAFWFGGPSSPKRYQRGADDGCFAAALASVRRWGGVLEHPAGSSAWAAFGLNEPPRAGGWVAADFAGGWTCCVEQGHYGHRARKPTWLLAYRVGSLPSLVWGPSSSQLVGNVPGRGGPRRSGVELMGHRERRATPPAFRDLLLSIARTVDT